jgi:hypothetical protein
MQLNWVPETTGVFPMVLLGWWPPGAAGIVALGVKWAMRKFLKESSNVL